MKAFSLIELLVVVALMAILMSLAMPAVRMSASMGISQAGDMVADQIALAKQEASTRSRDVEVRILQLDTNETAGFGGVQLWGADDLGAMKPLGRVVKLPVGVGVATAANISPLLGLTNGTIPGQNIPYRGFRIRSNGLPQREITAANNFLTVQSLRDGENLGVNFYAVRIHPLTGRITSYRP